MSMKIKEDYLRYLGGQSGNLFWKVICQWKKSGGISNPSGHNAELWYTVKIQMYNCQTFATEDDVGMLKDFL